ncbi:MAG: TetR/AcrR family transcriptional regulator [Lachnospiraceae bacterium]
MIIKVNKYEITTEKKKKSIVNAALSLFKENGFTSVSIKEIAALAQVSQVSIYNYFGSKETLVAECVDVVIRDIFQQSTDILAMELDFTEKIKLALSLCTEKINLSISEFFTQKALSDPAFVELITKNLSNNKSKIYREYIELGKQEKVIDSAIPTETLVCYIEALNIMGSKLEVDHDKPEKIKYIHHLFLYGLIGKE